MLHPQKYYHIYSHANGNENLFIEERNYDFFLQLIEKYLTEYVTVYAYCLMPNHFHLAVSIKSVDEIILFIKNNKLVYPVGEEEQYIFIQKKISKAFSNMFSSYTQSFNKVYKRKGSLFIPNFKSVEVNGNEHFCTLIYYIHKNPVHHGIVKNMNDWLFSSFNIFEKKMRGIVDRQTVIDFFGNEREFKKIHQQKIIMKSRIED